jgi:hypothetical protein
MMAYIRLGIGILIVLLLASTFFLIRKVDQLSGERSQLLEAAQDSGHIARTYINLHGQEVSKNIVLTQDLRNAKELKNNEAFKMASETKGVKKNLRNLEEVSNTVLSTQFTLVLPLKDTLISKGVSLDTGWWIHGVQPFFKTFNYVDKYNNTLKGVIDQDTIQVEAQIPTDIEGVVYWQRKHKFLGIRYGAKQSFSELKSTNPWVKIKDQHTIKIQKNGK